VITHTDGNDDLKSKQLSFPNILTFGSSAHCCLSVGEQSQQEEDGTEQFRSPHNACHLHHHHRGWDDGNIPHCQNKVREII